MCSMLAVYTFLRADGQKIAKRLCRQITKETNKLKRLVMEYNLRTSPDTELTVEMVIDPQNTLSTDHGTTLTLRQRHNIIQAYLRKKRSEEEIELLETEMKRTLETLLEKEEKLSHMCAKLIQNTDQFSRGAHNVITNIKLRIEHCIAKSRMAFNKACSLCIDSEECESESDHIDSDSDTEDDNLSYAYILIIVLV